MMASQKVRSTVLWRVRPMLDVPCVRLRVADTTTPRSLTPFAYRYIELLCLAISSVSLSFCMFIKLLALHHEG